MATSFPRWLAVLALLAACGDEGGRGGGGGGGGGVGGGGAGGGSGGAVAPLVEGYLRGDVYRALVLEVDSVVGFEPRTSSTESIEATVAALVDKPDGVTVALDGAIDSLGVDHAYTDQEILDLAGGAFDLAVDAETTKIHVLFLDGHSARDTEQGTVLGLAFDNRLVAIFTSSIEAGCGSTSILDIFRDELCASAEEIIWTHEIGHVLGLVNTGAPMQVDHEDDAHGGHDENQDCVMYWAFEGTDFLDELATRIVSGSGSANPTFDQACLDDLAAIRD